MRILMKSAVISAIALAATFAHADEKKALSQVKKFASTVACSLAEPGEYPLQWKTITLVEGDKELDGRGALYLVSWYGDLGCYGGNGNQGVHLTLVEQSNSSDHVVLYEVPFPKIDLVLLTGMSVKSDVLSLKGVAYGPKDHQGEPKKPVSYTFKYDPMNQSFVPAK